MRRAPTISNVSRSCRLASRPPATKLRSQSGPVALRNRLFFGSDQMNFTLVRTATVGSLTRDYHRLTDVIDDTIDARVYQGLHFRSADVQGARIGRQVAEWVAANAFQPVG